MSLQRFFLDKAPHRKSVSDWRARFATLNPKPIDLTLDRMRGACARLGHPERKIKPHIHISGTNGKGGVVAAFEAAFIDAGYSIQTYSSPFLWRFEENIRWNGVPISTDDCAHLFAKVWDTCNHIPLTWFEADTLVAFLAFETWRADITIIECGMGGASDATAIAPPPLAAILTNVGGDHTEFLGKDLGLVAQEKAGIAKGAPLYVTADFDYDVGPVQRVERGSMHPSLALANAVLSDHFSSIPPPNRMPVQMGRWTRDPQNPHIIYDVGHNSHAAKFLANRLVQEPGPYLIELGMLRRKDLKAFLGAFAHLETFLSPVDLGPEGHEPTFILDTGRELGMHLWQGEPVATRLITGSHQTVAQQFRSYPIPNERDAPHDH